MIPNQFIECGRGLIESSLLQTIIALKGKRKGSVFRPKIQLIDSELLTSPLGIQKLFEHILAFGT